MTVLNTDFLDELQSHGFDKTSECFNCGTCVALCPLQEGHFPRDLIRYAQIGAKHRIMERYADLWRCLHCGLCVESCPRGAYPGEFILALRNYLIRSWRKMIHV